VIFLWTHENPQHSVSRVQVACDLSPHDRVAHEVHLNPAEERELQNDSAIRSEIVYTVGEILPDGSTIEPVLLEDGRLGLLLWKDQQLLLAPQIDHNGSHYLPPVLPVNVQREMRFPRSAIDFGTSSELLEKISNLFETYIGLTPPQIPIAAAWVLSTWFAECWWRAPDLVITGWNMDLAVTFLRLLACLTRHPLMLTGVERATLRSLPMQVFPTLLINQPEISPRLLEFFRSSNYRHIVVPGTGRDVCAIGSKAIFLSTNATENGGFRISLPAAHCRRSYLTDFDCRQITDEFQPQLLMYRFRYFSRVCAQSSALPARSPGSQLVPLQACIQDDEEFSALVAAMVESREQEARAARARKPEVAMVEVLWAPSHNFKELKIKEITRSINTLIRTRGECLEYSEIEIGFLMGNSGLQRHRNGKGMVLRFSREICQRLHELAVEFGLDVNKIQGCAMCSPP
jgi:hypothetical protein